MLVRDSSGGNNIMKKKIYKSKINGKHDKDSSLEAKR